MKVKKDTPIKAKIMPNPENKSPSEVNVGTLLQKKQLFDLPQAREFLAASLEKKGISPEIVHAFRTIPRHAFANPNLAGLAYWDKYLWTEDTVLSTPSVVANMIQQLNLNKQKRVLEIGTGTGYQTALLSMLAGHVFSVDRVVSCTSAAKDALDALQVKNVKLRTGDGFEGWTEEAPFDAILVSATPPFVPRILTKQLNAQHGRMVMPVGSPHGEQRLLLLKRRGDVISKTDLGPTYFVPMVPTGSWEQAGGVANMADGVA